MAVHDQEERLQAGVEGDWICVGVLAGSHGVKGDMRLKSFTADPVAIFAFTSLTKGPAGSEVFLKKIRKNKEGFIVHVDGITSPEEAQALKGVKLYVQRDRLGDAKEDEFYLADLIGLKALDEESDEVGFVRAVDNFGADDLLELVLDAPIKGLGRHVFIPFTKLLVPEVNIRDGYVSIALEAWKKTQVSERDVGGEK